MLRTRPAVLIVSLIVLGCAGSEDIDPSISGKAGSSPSGRGGTTGSAGAGVAGTTGAAGGSAGASGNGGATGSGTGGNVTVAGAAGSTGGAGAAGNAGGGGGAGGRTPDPTATFTKIYNTIVPQCAGTGCHTAPPYAGGFNFSTKANAFKSWNDNVFPGFGEESPMFMVLNFGIMPKDRPSLSVDELFLVLDWINLGAKNN